MAVSEASRPAEPLLVLLDLARRSRRAESAAALQFMLVNQTMALVPSLVSLLWVEEDGVVLQSGVSHVERNSPFILWSNELCLTLADQTASCVVVAEMLSPEQALSWHESLPPSAYWLPINGYESRAGLLVTREAPFAEHEIALLNEWVDIWSHAWAKFAAPSAHGEFRRFWHRVKRHLPDKATIKLESKAVLAGGQKVAGMVREDPRGALNWVKAFLATIREDFRKRLANLKALGIEGTRLALVQETKAIWADRRRRLKWIFWIVVLFPVRLTVLAPGELVPANPAVIRVPIEGVVDEFYVSPNERVVAGQPLFRLDLTSLLSKLQVAQQEIQVATQEYRQSALQSLTDAKSRGQLATQEGKAAERKIEADYLQSVLDKAKIDAPRDGIVIFDDPSEWIGKPVVAGEKVMVVATDGDVEIEAWVPVGDALEVPKGAPITLYLNAAPFSPVSGSMRYMGHEPVQRPDGTYAYRIRASLKAGVKGPRVGWKGTAKVSGQFVPLVYWVLRKPLASLRQYLGV